MSSKPNSGTPLAGVGDATEAVDDGELAGASVASADGAELLGLAVGVGVGGDAQLASISRLRTIADL